MCIRDRKKREQSILPQINNLPKNMTSNITKNSVLSPNFPISNRYELGSSLTKNIDKRQSSESPIKTSTCRFHLPRIKEEFQDNHLLKDSGNISNIENQFQQLDDEVYSKAKSPDQTSQEAKKKILNNKTPQQQQQLTKFEMMQRLYLYPKLAKFAENQALTTTQQKALKDIITKKPALAASLDLYASSNMSSLSKLSQKNIERYLEEKLVYSPQKVIERSEQEKIKLLKEIKKIEKEKEQLQKQKNFSLQLTKQYNKHTTNNGSQSFYYCVGQGNNPEVVQRVISKRENWKEVPVYSSTSQFIWVPWSKAIRFQYLTATSLTKKIVNHFEFHREITMKSGLIKNLSLIAEDQKKNLFEITPTTFLINFLDNNWEYELQTFLEFFLKYQPKKLQTNKTKIEIKKKFKVISADRNSKQTVYHSYDFSRPLMKETFMRNENSYVWLLKPTNLNRGRGIEIFSTLEQLERLLNEYYEGVQEKIYNKPLAECQNCQSLENIKKIAQTGKHDEQDKNANANYSTTDDEKGKQPSKHILLPNPNSNQPHELNKSEEGENVSNSNNNNNNISHDNKLLPVINHNNKFPKTISTTQRMKKLNQTAIPSPNNKFDDTQVEKNVLQSQELKQQQPTTGENVSGNNNNSGSNNNNNEAANSNVCILKEHAFVIQKYIERPMLIHNRKFDIRIWSLLTQNMDLFVFKEGYLRMSSEVYNINDIDNAFIHLTNNAVQKYSKNYGQFESGNQLSFNDFQVWLDKNNQNCSVKNDIIPKIHEHIALSMMSIKKKINKNERRFCFELFGYDFIIDELYNVWLIEVNTNPCIEESSILLQQYIPRMLDDAFKLTVDQVFLPKFIQEEGEKQQKPEIVMKDQQKIEEQEKGDKTSTNSKQIPESSNNNDNTSNNNNDNTNIINPSNTNSNTNNDNNGNSNTNNTNNANTAENAQKNPQKFPNVIIEESITFGNDRKELQKEEESPNSDQSQQQQQQAQPQKSFWHVEGYSDYENMFEFIVNLNYQASKKDQLKFKKK
eukprot:TRINITY_DN6355_c0_g2_i2.p1 TRINITY_DN6355_c0_g2~~TRINITY_DN6355_c0_g2_i2.p1  ORF type:complete len:1019 (+),score=216.06 TRINITY_DN6355_c0_g2_i2:1004-4060(+)